MKVSFHKKFDKSYKKCPPKVQNQFKARLKLFVGNPRHPLLENHALGGQWNDFRSINITGDYRALYYHLSDDIIEFFIIGNHSDLYG